MPASRASRAAAPRCSVPPRAPRSPTRSSRARNGWRCIAQPTGSACPRTAPCCTDTSRPWRTAWTTRSEEHTSELQSRGHLVCRLQLEKKKGKHPNRLLTTEDLDSDEDVFDDTTGVTKCQLLREVCY